jgi:hypothetical protein
MAAAGSRVRAWLVGSWILGSVVACGGETSLATPPGSATGGRANGGEASGGASRAGAAGSLGGGFPVPPTDCVVAVHADQCCSQAVAVSAASMPSDPCLVPYGLEFLPSVIAACPAAERCASLNCIFPPPPSRIAAPDPNSPGNCRLADECASAADCTIASDLTGCCACPGALPQELGLANPCISPPGPPAGFVCNTCGPVMCEACPPTPVTTCTGPNASGYWICSGVY